MIEIFGLIKRLLTRNNKNLSYLLFFKLLWIYLKKAGTPGSINTGKWIIDYIDSKSFFYGYYEIFFRNVYDLDYRTEKQLRFLDVGSNIGLSILYLKDKYPHSTIVAIEADPQVYEILKKNIAVNKLSDVEVINKAAWKYDGFITFLPDSSDGGCITTEIPNGNVIKIEALNLSKVIDSHFFDFIKIDIEGAENDLFNSIKISLCKCPRIFLEYHSQKNKAQTLGEILNFFTSEGYRFNIASLCNVWSPFTNHTSSNFDGQYNIWFKKANMKLAPVVMFVYKRLDHTVQTVRSLAECDQCSDTDLYIYSDGPKSISENYEVLSVRNYIKNLKGFKSLTIIERDWNYGLAQNIIEGVSKVVNEFGKVIVIEDDLTLGKYFLTFMNEALSKYQSEKKIWHISGWNYPFEIEGFPDDTFLIRSMNCWGWATWADRWSYFEKDLSKIEMKIPLNKRNAFNLDGNFDFYSQIEGNLKGNLKTWAIFWYAAIFFNNGLCLNPVKSLVRNHGLDGTGENCDKNTIYHHQNLDHRPKLNNSTDNIEESSIAILKIGQFYKSIRPSLVQRILSKMNKLKNKLL